MSLSFITFRTFSTVLPAIDRINWYEVSGRTAIYVRLMDYSKNCSRTPHTNDLLMRLTINCAFWVGLSEEKNWTTFNVDWKNKNWSLASSVEQTYFAEVNLREFNIECRRKWLFLVDESFPIQVCWIIFLFFEHYFFDVSEKWTKWTFLLKSSYFCQGTKTQPAKVPRCLCWYCL